MAKMSACRWSVLETDAGWRFIVALHKHKENFMHIVTGQPFCVSVNGSRLNVRVDGPEGAPWMVFSNSLSSNITAWDEQVALFAPQFRFLRYDQRGHGGSDAPGAPFTMDALADDLLALLERFAIRNAVLVGVSMGATTVLRCAAREPSRCAGVVACDGMWCSASGTAAIWEERFTVIREQGMQGLVEPTVTRWFQPEFFSRKPEVVEKVRGMIAETSPEGYIACATALQQYDFRADSPVYPVPVLYAVGAQDGDLPAIMREMHENTPDSRYTVIGQCGHLPNIEQPEILHQAMDAFVRQIGVI